MASGFGPEGPDSILDAAKDPPGACDVRARKIWFRKPRGRSQAVYHGCCLWKKFPSIQRHIKIKKVDEGYCCHLSIVERQKWNSCY